MPNASPVVTRIDENAEYAAAVALEAKIRDQLNAERQIEDGIAARIVTWHEQDRLDDGMLDRAVALMGGANIDHLEAAPDLQREREASRRRQTVLTAGLRQHQSKIMELRSRLSIEACERFRTRHVELTKAVVAAAKALNAANEAEIAARIEILEAGFDTGNVPAVCFTGLIGLLSDKGSPIASFVFSGERYAAKHDGSLDPKRLVVVRALVDIPGYGAKSGQLIEVDELTGNRLHEFGEIDPVVSAAELERYRREHSGSQKQKVGAAAMAKRVGVDLVHEWNEAQHRHVLVPKPSASTNGMADQATVGEIVK